MRPWRYLSSRCLLEQVSSPVLKLFILPVSGFRDANKPALSFDFSRTNDPLLSLINENILLIPPVMGLRPGFPLLERGILQAAP